MHTNILFAFKTYGYNQYLQAVVLLIKIPLWLLLLYHTENSLLCYIKTPDILNTCVKFDYSLLFLTPNFSLELQYSDTTYQRIG